MREPDGGPPHGPAGQRTGEPDAPPVRDFATDQLAGFRIGVTADRRSADLNSAFTRRGAEVLHAPTLRIVPASADAQLVADTRAVIAAAPEVLLVTTSYGLNGWLEAADSAGIGEDLLAVLAAARIFVRGPKARGAVRGAGLHDAGAGALETTASLVDTVLAELAARPGGARGLRVALQLHGYVDDAQLQRITGAGAQLLTVAPYRWSAPPDPGAVDRLIDATIARALDAVVFTSAPAADALLRVAAATGRHEALRASLDSDDVLCAAVGTVTAEPLRDAGITPAHPERHRLGALVRMVCEHLERGGVRRAATTAGHLELRGRLAMVDGRRVMLSPSATTLLRLLVDAGGAVLTRQRLREALPEAGDDHAVEVAVARLRQALGAPGMVTTVVKRGYRLAPTADRADPADRADRADRADDDVAAEPPEPLPGALGRVDTLATATLGP